MIELPEKLISIRDQVIDHVLKNTPLPDKLSELKDWYELPENKESHIGVVKDNADFSNQSDWDNQFNWLATNLERLDKVFRNRVKKVDI